MKDWFHEEKMDDKEYLECFHEEGDLNCLGCKEIDAEFPKRCKCGGLIHIYEYWYDEFDSETRDICDNCFEKNLGSVI
jgi:hypothetical protein